MSFSSIPEIGPRPDYDRDVGVLLTMGDLGYRSSVVRSYPSEPVMPSLDVFKLMMVPVARYLKGECHVLCVVYETLPHGNEPRKDLFWGNPLSLDDDIRRAAACFEDKDLVNVALSGILRVRDTMYFIPAIDLEFPYDDQRLKTLALQKLQAMGMTGFFANSGFGCHFIADFFMRYGEDYWRILGLVMKHLVYDEDGNSDVVEHSKCLGDLLLEARTLKQAEHVASKILHRFPSQPTGQTRPGLLFDPRWIGHRLQREGEERLVYNTLRVTTGKYASVPVFDSEFF